MSLTPRAVSFKFTVSLSLPVQALTQALLSSQGQSQSASSKSVSVRAEGEKG